MGRKPNNPIAVAQCPKCAMRHRVVMESAFKVGYLMLPFPGGGDYGRCLRCRRPGLKIVVVPQEPVKKPVGWSKVPK